MRFALLIICLSVFAAGCNSDPRCRREIALLRAEILDLEDKFYLSKAQRDQALSELNTYTGMGGASSNSSAGPIIYESYGQPSYSGNGQGQTIITSPNDDPFAVAPLNTGDAYLENIEPLRETPTQAKPGQSDDTLPIELKIEDGNEPGNSVLDNRLNLTLNAAETNSVQNPITEIVINRRQTRGADLDGIAGDEGLELLVQPKSANGQTLLQAGELTVSVVERSDDGRKQRLGIWKFLPPHTEMYFTKNSADAPGILLHLPWNKVAPPNSRVIIFVRFETRDGRRLETSSEIPVNPPAAIYPEDDPLIADWMLHDSRWLNSNPVANEDFFLFEEQFVDDRPMVERGSIPAIPASSGSSRIFKPSWRPIR